MSDKQQHASHGATTIHASKGGGGGKWLLAGVAAVVLLGGGYLAWKNYAPGQTTSDLTYNDQYADAPLHAGPMAPSDQVTAEAASAEVSAPAPAPRPAARRATARAAAAEVPEETVGITPVSLTAADNDDIVVRAPRRPVWSTTPSSRRLSALYPASAAERGREGEASLHCIVQQGGALDCERVSSTPGFGNAALRVARSFRHAPQLADGSDAAGSPVNLRVVFRMPEENRRG